MAAPGPFNPPRGYKWKVVGAHSKVQQGAAAHDPTPQGVIYLAQDNAGPHGQVIADSGQAPAVNGQTGVGEGGVSSAGFFTAAQANESKYTSWGAEMEANAAQSIVVAFLGGLGANSTYQYRINIIESVDLAEAFD